MKELLIKFMEKFGIEMDISDEELDRLQMKFINTKICHDIQDEISDMISEYMDVELDSHADEIKEWINTELSEGIDKEILEECITTLKNAKKNALIFEEYIEKNHKSLIGYKDFELYNFDVYEHINNSQDSRDFEYFRMEQWDCFKHICETKKVNIEYPTNKDNIFELQPILENEEEYVYNYLFDNISRSYPIDTSYTYEYISSLLQIDAIKDPQKLSSIIKDEISWTLPKLSYFPNGIKKQYGIPNNTEAIEQVDFLICFITCNQNEPSKIYNLFKNFYIEELKLYYDDNVKIDEFISTLSVNDILKDIAITYSAAADATVLAEIIELYDNVKECSDIFDKIQNDIPSTFKNYQEEIQCDIEETIDNLSRENRSFILRVGNEKSYIIELYDNSNITISDILNGIKDIMKEEDTTKHDIEEYLRQFLYKDLSYYSIPQIMISEENLKEKFKGYYPDNFDKLDIDF